MKKIVSIILCLIMVLTCACSCEEKKELTVEEVASTEEISERIALSMHLPDTAKYAAYFIVEQTMGEVQFTFNGLMFTYRASKLAAGDGLHNLGDKFAGTTTIAIGDRADVTVDSLPDGGRVATWTHSGTNYSLYTQKGATDDVFTELCDLLIK